MTSPEVIAGAARIPHEAIEDFIRRADEYLESKAESNTDFTAVAFLDDAVVNLRQLLAEYALLDAKKLPDLQVDEAAALLTLAQRCTVDGPGAFARFATSPESPRDQAAGALLQLIPSLVARCRS